MEAYQICLIIYTIIFIVTLIAEILTDQLVCVWFTIGSLCGLVTNAITRNNCWWVSIIIFVIVSFASLIIFLVFFRKLVFKNRETKTNAQELIGEEFNTISETDPNSGYAKIKVFGIIYNVSCDETLALDDKVKIADIKGNHLIVKKVKEEKND